MTDDRSRILSLLSAGKITAEEAERLLDALDSPSSAAEETPGATGAVSSLDDVMKAPGAPKFMYVKVVSVNGDNVDVKVPLALVRAGLKLTSLIPPQAMDQINDSMSEHGMSIDFSNLKPEDVEELIEALREMEVNVDAANGDNVRVFCA